MERSVWDRLSGKYDRLWVQRYSLKPTRERIIESLARYADSNRFSLLDLGCGTGQLLDELTRLYPDAEFMGVDKSAAMIAEARAKCSGAVFYAAEAGTSLTALVDFVVCSHSFPYYADKESVVKYLKRQLKQGGYAIFVQASINNTYDRAVMWLVEKTAEPAKYLSRCEFKRLFADGFEVAEEFSVRQKWYMPSICGFVLRRL